MARSRTGSTDEAEDTTAVRPSCNALGPTTSHGAPRASRPCGRLRRCAPRSLDPCSRRGLGAAMPTKAKPSLASQRKDCLSPRFFLVDGGVQIRVLDGSLDHRRHKRPRPCGRGRRFRTPVAMSPECRTLRPIRTNYSAASACLVAPAPGPAPLDCASVGASRLWQPSPDRSTTTDLSAAEARPIDRASLRRPPSPTPSVSPCRATPRLAPRSRPQVVSNDSRCRSPSPTPPRPHHRITRIDRACAVSLRTSTHSKFVFVVRLTKKV